MNKDIIYFDLETTGVDIKKDNIIELYCLKVKQNGEELEYHQYFNTDVEISSDAYSKHGISNEFLKDKPYFKEKAEFVYSFFKDCDLSGFNIVNFDIALLHQELYKCGFSINFFNVKTYDVFKILTHNEPRTLEGYYKRVFNEELINSHSAKSDVLASKRLLEHQIDLYYNGNISNKINDDVRIDSNGYRMLDYSGFFKIKDNIIYYNKGKYKNKPINIDLDYLKYIASDNSGDYFESNVRVMAKVLIKKCFDNQ